MRTFYTVFVYTTKIKTDCNFFNRTTGPPKVACTWRHWSEFKGPYDGTPPSGKQVEMYGMLVSTLNQVINFITAHKQSCGKVMLSNTCVILSTWESLSWGGGFCSGGLSRSMRGGLCLEVGISRDPPPPHRISNVAGGTHPTGIHSCFMCHLIC